MAGFGMAGWLLSFSALALGRERSRCPLGRAESSAAGGLEVWAKGVCINLVFSKAW